MPESPGRTITKKELVDRIAFELDQTKLVVRHVVQQFLNEISAELAAGNRIEFREFGVFEVRQRGRRRGQLPQLLVSAKDEGDAPAKQMERVVKFRPGRALRELGEPDGPTPAAQRPAPTPPRPEAPAVRPAPPKPPPSTPGSPF